MRIKCSVATLCVATLFGCQDVVPEAKTAGLAPSAAPFAKEGAVAAPIVTEQAIFAGGCFWCVESDFDKVPGVIETISGYTGGSKANPTYQEVSSETTGHAEAVRVTYDPSKVTYSQLLDHFWKHIDPTVEDAQFCDHGNSYRSAIFAVNAEQKRLAEASKAALEKSGKFKHVYTEVVSATPFYPAEDYHQDYYIKNPVRYKYYRTGCGRDARLAQVWGETK